MTAIRRVNRVLVALEEHQFLNRLRGLNNNSYSDIHHSLPFGICYSPAPSLPFLSDRDLPQPLILIPFIQRADEELLLPRFVSCELSEGSSIIRYKSGRGENTSIKSFQIDYDPKLIPDPSVLIRDEIKLETSKEKKTRKTKVQIAKILAAEIKDKIHSGQISDVKNDAKQLSREVFLKVFESTLDKYDFPQALEDAEIVILSAYYCLKTDIDSDIKKQEGFLSRLPDGLLDAKDDNFLIKAKVLAKHYFIDLMGLTTASDIEGARNINRGINKAGLRAIDRAFSLLDLYKYLFPGYLDGENPPIRPWFVAYPKKWHGEEGKALATRASQWVLKHGEGVVNVDGTFNLEKIRSKNWSEVFYKEEYDLKGMMASCPFIRNSLDAIKLAAPELIGLHNTQIHPWEIQCTNMWTEQGKDGWMLIDDVTEYIVEHYLPSQGVNLLDVQGKPIASKILEIPNWARLYQGVVPSSLIRTKIRAVQALQRKYPDLFGYGHSQIKPWEIRYSDKWVGEHGKMLFRQALAYAICESMQKVGLGEFYLNEVPPKFTFTKEQFELWYKTELQDKKKDLRDFINENKLSSGLSEAAGNNISSAVKILFDVTNDEPGLPETRSIKPLFLELLERSGNNFTVLFHPYEFPLTSASQKQIVSSYVPKLLSRINEPLDGKFIMLYTEQNKRAREELSGVGASMVFDTGISDINGTNISKILSEPEHPGNLALKKMKEVLLGPGESGQGRFYVLESVLTSSSGSNGYIISEQKLRDLLEIVLFVMEDININPKSDFKAKFRQLLGDLIRLPGDPRDVLIPAVKAAKFNFGASTFPDTTHTIEALDRILEFTLDVVARQEIERLEEEIEREKQEKKAARKKINTDKDFVAV